MRKEQMVLLLGGLLLAAAAVFMLVIGKPWDESYLVEGTERQKYEPAGTETILSTASDAEADDWAGSVDLSRSSRPETFFEGLFDIGFRGVAADFERYKERAGKCCISTADLMIGDEYYTPEGFAETIGDAFIRDRAEMACEFEAIRETTEKDNVVNIEGILHVTPFSKVPGEVLGFFGVEDLPVAECRDIPVRVELLNTGKDWKIISASCGTLKD